MLDFPGETLHQDVRCKIESYIRPARAPGCKMYGVRLPGEALRQDVRSKDKSYIRPAGAPGCKMYGVRF